MLFDEIYTYEPPSYFEENIGFLMLIIFAGVLLAWGVFAVLSAFVKRGRSMRKENEIERTVANQKVGL